MRRYLLLLTLLITLPAFAALPDLPASWREKLKPTQQWVFIDFYSPTCGTCQRLEPYLKKLQKELGSKIKFEHADIMEAENKPLSSLYHVTGTPTYILFRRDGKTVYRMQHSLSIEVLSAQLKRLIGVTPPQPGLTQLTDVNKSREQNPFVLLAVHPKGCTHCQTMTPYLNAIQQAKALGRLGSDIGVVTLDPARKDVADWLKTNRYKSVEAYALYDQDGKLLFYSPYPLASQELWRRVRLFTDMGL